MRIGGNFVGLGWGLVVREEAKEEEEEWRREKGWWVRGRMEGSETVAIFSVAKVEEEEEMELSFLSTFGVLVHLE